MSMSLLLGWGAYVRDKNTSARLCAKNAGGGGAFAGHYGNKIYRVNFLLFWSLVCLIPKT